MISAFRLKAQTTQGIDVEVPSVQAAEICSLIGATSFSVDVLEGAATFTVEGIQDPIVVKTGQVISVTAGAIAVQDRAEFYEMFEASNGA